MASTFRSSPGTATPRSIESDERSHKIVGDIQKEINAQYEAESGATKEVKVARPLHKFKPCTRITLRAHKNGPRKKAHQYQRHCQHATHRRRVSLCETAQKYMCLEQEGRTSIYQLERTQLKTTTQPSFLKHHHT